MGNNKKTIPEQLEEIRKTAREVLKLSAEIIRKSGDTGNNFLTLQQKIEHQEVIKTYNAFLNYLGMSQEDDIIVDQYLARLLNLEQGGIKDISLIYKIPEDTATEKIQTYQKWLNMMKGILNNDSGRINNLRKLNNAIHIMRDVRLTMPYSKSERQKDLSRIKDKAKTMFNHVSLTMDEFTTSDNPNIRYNLQIITAANKGRDLNAPNLPERFAAASMEIYRIEDIFRLPPDEAREKIEKIDGRLTRTIDIFEKTADWEAALKTDRSAQKINERMQMMMEVVAYTNERVI